MQPRRRELNIADRDSKHPQNGSTDDKHRHMRVNGTSPHTCLPEIFPLLSVTLQSKLEPARCIPGQESRRQSVWQQTRNSLLRSYILDINWQIDKCGGWSDSVDKLVISRVSDILLWLFRPFLFFCMFCLAPSGIGCFVRSCFCFSGIVCFCHFLMKFVNLLNRMLEAIEMNAQKKCLILHLFSTSFFLQKYFPYI